MKHLFTLLVVLFSLIAGGNLRAQNTIEFLGIPVDGNKSDVLSALEDKGFVPSYDNQRLGGVLDGYDVWVYAVTNDDGVVRRVVVADVDSYDEVDIKIRYNEVFRQILDSEEYEVYRGRMLTTGDDVVAGMKEDATQYQTSFLPKSGANGVLWFTIAEHYGTYYIMRFYENLDNQ